MRLITCVVTLASFALSACSAHLQGNPGHSQAKVHVNPAQVKVKVK